MGDCARADPRLLTDVLSGTVPWISGNLQQFNPFKNGTVSAHDEVPLAELAILARCALRSSEPTATAALPGWLDFLEAQLANPVLAERPFREPETLVSNLMVALALAESGRTHDGSIWSAAERLVRASNLTAPALPPHRMMELRHVLDLAGLRHSLPSYRELYLATAVSRDLNPIYATKAEAYIVTHVIFYGTDLGVRLMRGVGSGEISRLSCLVGRLLGMYIAAGNWDLTAELLLCASALRQPVPFFALGWTEIAAAQLASGAVPGPSAQVEDGAIKDEAQTCYHTTLAASIAALICLAPTDWGGPYREVPC